jgi:hypothetical protein
MNMARADILDYSVALDVTKYLRHEQDYMPWKTAISDLFYIDSMLIRSSDYHLMKVICCFELARHDLILKNNAIQSHFISHTHTPQRYFTTRIEKIYAQVGFEDQGDVLTMLLRNEILKAACHLGIKDCIHKATQEYFKWTLEANPDINNP